MSTIAAPGGALPSSFASKLMFIAICCVPFQQAFTIPVGFPLKISEIAGMLAVALFIVEGRRASFRYAGAALQWVLLALVFASTTWWLLVGAPADTAQGYERGMNADMLLYLVYAVIVIFVSWFAGTRLGPDWIARGFGVATWLAAGYSLLQFVLHLGGASALLRVVQGTVQVGAAYGVGMSRNGPFLEGNYLGFFAGIAFFLALRRKARWTAVAAAFCLLYSQSTIAIVGIVAAILLVSLFRPSGKIAAVISGVLLAGIMAVTFIPVLSVFVTRQLGKLGLISSPELGSSIEYSMQNRTATIQRGLDMSAHFPILGVGPGRYGYWDQFYSLTSGATGGRGIANNAYVQIISEIGVPAFLCFASLLIVLLVRNAGARRSELALVGFVVVSLNASPSWTALPIWFGIAYLATSWRRSAARNEGARVDATAVTATDVTPQDRSLSSGAPEVRLVRGARQSAIR